MTPARRLLKLMALFAVAAGGGLCGRQLLAGLHRDTPIAKAADYSGTLLALQAPCVVLGELWCPHCRQARTYLQQRRTACRFVEISASSEAQAVYGQLGRPGFPILITDDQAIIGFAEARWESALRRVLSN